MSIVDEIARLQEMHESGALTADESTTAKTQLLAENDWWEATQSASMQRDVRRLGIRDQILQLDQEWERERQTYRVRGGVPTKDASLFGAIGFTVLGLFLCGVTFFVPHGGPQPVFGVFMIILAAVMGVSGFVKADAYGQSEERYQRRRAELTTQLELL